MLTLLAEQGIAYGTYIQGQDFGFDRRQELLGSLVLAAPGKPFAAGDEDDRIVDAAEEFHESRVPFRSILEESQIQVGSDPGD